MLSKNSRRPGPDEVSIPLFRLDRETSHWTTITASGGMAGLQSLPEELVLNIGSFTEHEDRERLRLVCQVFSRIWEPQVLHTIYLNFHNGARDLKHNLSMIRWLATAPPFTTPFSRSTRCLVLGSLSPRLNYLLWIYRMKMLRDDSYNPPALQIAEEEVLISAENKIRKYLFKAIASLHKLQSVRWTTAKNDEAWSQKIMAEALHSLPSLKALNIDMEYLRVDLPVSFLRNLSRISVSVPASYSTGPSPLLDNFSEAVALSAPCQVTHLELVIQHYYSPSRPSLHHFLRLCTTSDNLRLQHLKIKNLSLKLDDFIAPHLMNLTSLDMSNVHEPPSDPATESGSSSVAGDIWVQLTRMKTHLQQIAVSAVTLSFLDYLKAYSGLKSLILKVPTFDNREQSEKYALLFFRGGALAKHVDTLEDLRIHAAYEDCWCFGEHSISLISKCWRLRHLEMAISTEDLRVPAAEQQSGSVWDDVLGVLITTVASRLPGLAHLTVASASPERFRFASVCGNGVSNHFAFARDKLLEHLEAYRAPAELFKLPLVSIDDRGDSRTFEPVLERNESDFTGSESAMGGASFWRYCVPAAGDGDAQDWLRDTRIGA